MATNEKPLFVFIPGAWHGPEGFDAVRKGLSQQGYSSEAIALPSIGAEPPNKGLHYDIVHVYGILKQLADQGKQIILVVHSYGGMVGSGAVKGVEYAQRVKDGEKGGVIMLVFMCAFVTPKGSSLRDMLGGQWLPWFVIKGEYMYSSDEGRIFYHDLPKEEQDKWTASLKHISLCSFTEPATNEPWKDGIPCSYLLCEKDMAIPIGVQEQLANALGENAKHYRLGSSHSPFLSMPKKLSEVLDQVAKTSTN